MKILVLASTVPADDDDRVPRFVTDQARAMADADAVVEIDVLAPHTPSSHALDWPRPVTDDGRVRQYRHRYTLRRWETLTAQGIMPALSRNPAAILLVPALMFGQFFATWRFVRRARPDVIYAHWFTPQALTARVVGRLTGTPFGFTTHASDVAVWKRFGPPGRWVVRSVVRRARFMTAVSNQTAEKLLEMLRGSTLVETRERLRIVPMGVDVAATDPRPGDPCHVGIVARLVEKKGVEVLLRAWPSVVSAVPDARLTVAGDGPQRNELEELANALGLDVSFPGYVVGPAKELLLDDIGIVVQPSIVARDGDADGLPVALLEGLARGKIGVASDASGAQDIVVDGVDARLVAAGDPDALAQALVDVLLLSSVQRADMARAARRTARSLAWPKVADVHLAIIRESCRDGRARPRRRPV